MSSATSRQRGGKMAKSTLAVPWECEGEVSYTVNMDGSGWWSKLTVLMQLKRAMSYLYGA